jgi:hypothetical protein
MLVVLGAAAIVVHVWPARERGAKLPSPVAQSVPVGVDAAELAISRWQSPTAFLLEPPKGSL